MRCSPRLCYSLVWLPLIFIVLAFGAVLAVEPPAWTATVPVFTSQTVPPFDFVQYLPQLVATPKLTRLTNHPAREFSPAWSFDGTHLAYLRLEGDRHQIRRIKADGSDSLLLLDEQGAFPDISDLHATWSPDGIQIAYILGEGIRQLYVMKADGTAKQVVASMANLTDLTWSPDGKRIAFGSDGAIYTIAPDGSNLTMLATEAAAHIFPVWSPDSSQIAYYDSGFGTIVIQDVATGTVTQLAHSTGVVWSYSRFRWSPNGKMMAFVYHTVGDGGQPQAEIGVVEITSGKLTRVTTHFAVEHDLAWSPDSSELAFARSADIHVINADGSDYRILTQGFGEVSLPVWSPDGNQIAFISKHEGRQDAYVIASAGGTPTRLTLDTTTIQSVAQSVAWSPRGNYLLIAAYREVYDGLHLMSAEGGASINPFPESDTGRFVWSPVAPYVAFTVRRSPLYSELYRADANGDHRTRLSANLFVDYFAWSPDGQKLVFTAAVDAHTESVYVVDISGTHLTKLVTVPSSPIPTWSPDSKRIAFVNGTINVIEVEGGTLKTLSDTYVSSGEPSWSPEGEWLAYFGNSYDVFVVPPEGGTPRQLTNDMAEEVYSPLAWAPDSRRIAYISGQSDPTCDPRWNCPTAYSLYMLKLDGSRHKVVEEDPYEPSWSPDGRHLLFFSYKTGLTLVDAEGENRTELGVGPDNLFSWSWSPDGRRIVLNFAGDIYILDIPTLP